MQEVLNVHNIKLVLDLSKKRLYQTWTGYVKVEDFKAAIDQSVACFKQYPLRSILSDTTHQAVLAKEGSDYAASVMPELIKHGLKKVGFVLPKSAFTKLSVENFQKHTQQFLTGYFSSLEEAEAWLDEASK